MTPKYQIAVTHNGTHRQGAIGACEYELPCVNSGEAKPRLRFEFGSLDDGHEIAVISNLSSLAIQIGEQPLNPGEQRQMPIPFCLQWPESSAIVFKPTDLSDIALSCQTLGHLNRFDEAARANQSSPAFVNHSPAPQTLEKWFRALSAIQREAASSEKFLQLAVQSAVEPGGLDAAFLLERKAGNWSIRCGHVSEPAKVGIFEPAVAELTFAKKEPLSFTIPNRLGSEPSTNMILSVPVFGAQSEVAAILYVMRTSEHTNRRRQIRDLEALWIELVADAITSGYQRMDREEEAARNKILLAQAFPNEVIHDICSRPYIDLPTENREVTILFADLINSSAFCESNTAETIIDFYSEVMDTMTSVVHRFGGVVVDYCGDGLVAMWNAPTTQPDHAVRACKAALSIRDQMTMLDRRWSHRLSEPVRLGQGIHTGMAVVGNSGSRHKIKYGPRGHTMNVASRIEKATRRLNQPLLISGDTYERLPSNVSAYRIGKFKLCGIEGPSELFALFSLDSTGGANECCEKMFNEINQLIESRQFSSAAQKLKRCQNCECDELSLCYLYEEINALSEEVRRAKEPIYDLARQR